MCLKTLLGYVVREIMDMNTNPHIKLEQAGCGLSIDDKKKERVKLRFRRKKFSKELRKKTSMTGRKEHESHREHNTSRKEMKL